MSIFASGDQQSSSVQPMLLGADGGSDTSGDLQQHDRIQVQEQDIKNMAGSGSGSGSADTDITVSQRMMSATLGSVLTSLLGRTTISQAILLTFSATSCSI